MMQYINVLKARGRGANAGSAFKSDMVVSVDAQNTIRTVMNECSVNGTGATANITCGTSSNFTVTALVRSMCINAISISQNNGLIEGDASIDEGVSDDDVDKADADIAPDSDVKRLLQTQTNDQSIQLQVAEGNERPYENILADDSIVPQGTVETTNAGDNVPGSSLILNTLFVMISAIAVTLTL